MPTVVDVSSGGRHLAIADHARTVWLYAVERDGVATAIGNYAASLPVEDSAVHGRTLFLTDGRAELEVVNITTPSASARMTVTHGIEWEVSARYGYDFMVQRRLGGGLTVRAMAEVPTSDDDDDEDDDHCDDDHGHGHDCSDHHGGGHDHHGEGCGHGHHGGGDDEGRDDEGRGGEGRGGERDDGDERDRGRAGRRGG